MTNWLGLSEENRGYKAPFYCQLEIELGKGLFTNVINDKPLLGAVTE